MILKFAKALSLNKEQIEEFLHLVKLNQAEDTTERNVYLKKLSEARINQKLKSGEIDQKTWEKIPSWISWILYSLIDQKDETINKKVKAALASGVKVILCVGEENREAGFSYLPIIKNELVEALAGVSKQNIKNLVIAYEPVWAIGKKATREATPKEIEEVVIFIKRVIGDLYDTKTIPPIKILYGGSVNPENASLIMDGSGVDGLLIGRASVSPKIYKSIIESLAS
jgi:hypothetical protein